MIDSEYVYEGTCRVKCSSCGFVHEVFFTGDDSFHPVEAIDMVLLEEGWEATRMLCPNCYDALDPIDDKKMKDELEEEYFDEYGDCEEDYETDMEED